MFLASRCIPLIEGQTEGIWESSVMTLYFLLRHFCFLLTAALRVKWRNSTPIFLPEIFYFEWQSNPQSDVVPMLHKYFKYNIAQHNVEIILDAIFIRM